jgi:RsiW-degrading membrane proteinase PrsW (M82 family)
MGGIPARAYDPERTRRIIGLVLYIVLMLCAGTLLLAMFLLSPLLDPKSDPATEYYAMAIGACLALPALFVYLWLPWIIDRYDPEPLWALTLVLLWGAVGACGFAAVINTTIGGVAEVMVEGSGEAIAACISAPIFEEGLKGLGVLGMYWFVKREFDGVVDGIIYASFCALGFAACENILYYGHAASQEMTEPGAEGVFAATVIMRGVMSPWIHPLFTSMTGIGVGIARETSRGWVRWLAPMGGYCCAVILHSTWNTAATLSGMLTVIMLPLWFLFVLGFFAIVITLVVRKGRIIRQHLQDEVLLGNLTPQELDLVSSAWAHWRATFSFGGSLGRQFVTAAARLGLSKWHAARAAKGHSRTVSADFVVPLRQDLRRLRDEISRKLGRQLPQPQPWQPPQGPQYQPYPQYPPQRPPNPYSPYGT